MKAITFIFALACMLSSLPSGFAQAIIRPQVGVNSSNLSGDAGLFEFNNGTGYQLGVDFQIGNRIYVQPGIQLEFLKNELELTGATGITDESKYNRTGLRVPFMIGYRLGEDADNAFNFRLFTGPNALLQLSSDTDDDVELDEDILKDLVFGWNIGVGLDLPLFFVDIGYQFGLSEILENVENAPRNNLFYASAGIRINL